MKTLGLFAMFVLAAALWAQDSTSSPAPTVASEPLPVPAVDVALTVVNGTVEIKKAGSEAWVPAVKGATITEKDAIRTGAGSDVEILLPDQSVLKLKENTALEIGSLKDTVVLLQKQGAVFYKITPVAAARPPFKVGTPTATALVYGTAFAGTVKDAATSSFAVVQGKIGVKGASGEEVFVKAGEFSRATAGAVDKPKALAADALKRLEEWSKVNYEAYTEPVKTEPAPSSGENAQGGGATVQATAEIPVGDQPKADAEAAAAKDGAKEGEKAEKKDEKPASGKKGGGIQWSVGMGSVTVDGKQWNRLSLRPDIPIGNFGICLDIELFVDDQGNISNKGWNFDNAANAFESIQRKIYYIRYGHPGDKFYAKVGALDDVTLGYGFIMYGYSNSLQYPDVRKMGLHTELNEISSLGISFQGMINNFSDFNRDGALIGTRLSVKPLNTLGLPIISNLSVGASYVSDMNQRAVLRDRDGDKVPDVLDQKPDDKQWAIEPRPFSPNDNDTIRTGIRHSDSLDNRNIVNRYSSYITGKDPFSMAGADLGLPLLKTKLLSVLVYGSWAMDIDDKNTTDPLHSDQMKGWGIAAPGVGVGVGPLKINVEYRYFKDEFQGEYFDQTYELDRMKQVGNSTLLAKEAFLAEFDRTTMNGIFSRAGLNIFNLVNAGASYQWMKIKYDYVIPDTVSKPTANQAFSANAGIGETVKTILRKVKIADIMAYYVKKNIGTWPVGLKTNGEEKYDKFLEATPFVLMGYKVGFQLASTMVLYWDTQYTYVVDPTAGDPFHLKLEKRLNIETVLKF